METNKTLEIKNMQPLVLAFIGDAVHTLFVRNNMVQSYNYKVNKLNQLTKNKVNALFQSNAFKKIEHILTDDEKDIARRARNANKAHTAKNYSVQDYNYATALEAVIGFLYLTNQNERLDQILNLTIAED